MTLSVRYAPGQVRLLSRLEIEQTKLTQSLERLSTGKRINHAKDDPAGLIATEQLRGELIDVQARRRGLAYSSLKEARREVGLARVQDLLTELRGNVVSASGDTLSNDQKQALQQLVDAALDAIDRISNQIEGVGGSSALVELRSGGEQNLVNGDLEGAQALVDSQNQGIYAARVTSGAYQRYTVDSGLALYDDLEVALTDAISLIEDADFAVESSNLVRSQVLLDAAQLALGVLLRTHAQTVSDVLHAAVQTVDELA